MVTLVLPVAGQSTRFPGMRPKWLLTMPDGALMFEKSVERLDMAAFDRVVVICLQAHVEEWTTADRLAGSFAERTGVAPDFVQLPEPTSSQSETVALAVERAGITGAMFVKDCDNMFACSPTPGNWVATVDLNQVELIDAKNKSYVQTDGIGVISNIVEKEVVSNLFSCGGYGFESATDFVSVFDSIGREPDVYLSHVIHKMLLTGVVFRALPCDRYVDWGTLREYRHYCKRHITVFCDVDGVLLFGGSKFAKQGWKTEPIVKNITMLRRLQEEGMLYLVLTSSRPQSEEEYTRSRLAEFGLRVDRCVFGLPHSRRYLVNDCAPTNPYPSAVAINLERNSDALDSFMSGLYT